VAKKDAIDFFGDPGDGYLDLPCPGCGLEKCVYNGNYYCTSCTWAMPEGWPVQPWLRSLIRQRRALGEDTTHAEFYLTDESRKLLEQERR
jgi:hypothetical protein